MFPLQEKDFRICPSLTSARDSSSFLSLCVAHQRSPASRLQTKTFEVLRDLFELQSAHWATRDKVSLLTKCTSLSDKAQTAVICHGASLFCTSPSQIWQHRHVWLAAEYCSNVEYTNSLAHKVAQLCFFSFTITSREVFSGESYD